MAALILCIVLILTFTLKGSVANDADVDTLSTLESIEVGKGCGRELRRGLVETGGEKWDGKGKWASGSLTHRTEHAPHEWNITRDMWLAAWANNTQTTEPFEPLRLVVIQHTVSPECHRFITCAAEIRNLQSYFLNNLGYDIPYNFMVGNDGRVYEGRGLGMVGAHTFGYNSCTIGLGFIGDYREGLTVVTPLQVQNVHKLLDIAVERGLLRPDYHVVGARDLRGTQSPGVNLYEEIQTWPHYDHNGLYHNKTCIQIHEMFNNSTA